MYRGLKEENLLDSILGFARVLEEKKENEKLDKDSILLST